MIEPRYVESRDGTVIGFRSFGEGPPMVLVHGAAVDRRSWSAVLPRLMERFTVHVMDRRGRGRSTAEGGAYDIAREGEDVAAVIAAAGRDVFVIGHSYGALCVLEAAPVTDAIGRIVLYEPPVPTPGVRVTPRDALDRLRALALTGDHDALLEIFFRDVIQLSPAELDALRSDPRVWQAHLGNAPPLMREIESVERFQICDRHAAIDVPVRLLLGAESPDYHRPATEALAKRLPHADLVTLPGQGHMAIDQAPGLFASAVLTFTR
jgi:pimeloyl-ACP methyl ester carboxylesterase